MSRFETLFREVLHVLRICGYRCSVAYLAQILKNFSSIVRTRSLASEDRGVTAEDLLSGYSATLSCLMVRCWRRTGDLGPEGLLHYSRGLL